MPNVVLARAFSSEDRWKVLDLLMTGDLSESQIRRALGLNAPSLRGHLEELVNARLVEVHRRKLPSGREEAVYRIARSAQSLVFPPRKYEGLSEALIEGLISSLGEESARLVIRDIGLKLGERVGHSLLANTASTELSMDGYAELVVGGLLRSQGAYPRVVSRKGSELVYEQYNCQFQELAAKMPGLMCDVMDEAVHEGLDRALKVKTTRLTCMGHGDVGCRFRVVPRNRA